LSSTGAYFSAIAGLLPGRAVAVDPPGWGRSPPLEDYTYERLVDLAGDLVGSCRCSAVIGHSLGGEIAAGVAGAPPPGLRAVVLVDGGYLDAATRAELGLPVTASRGELIAWWDKNTPRFPDWETAVQGLAALFGAEVTPSVEEAVRASFAEVDGQIRESATPDQVADLLLAVVHQDVAARAQAVAVPTLLIACGQPAAHRAIKERAWREVADASPLIELHVAEEWDHNPFLQSPEASALLISEWLQRYL